jgi:succinate dehydrogenase / fumarate reductase cytochrome b subunit
MRYRLQPGSFAWLIHRISGITLSIYIIFHVYFFSGLKDPIISESLRKLVENQFIKFGKAGLLFMVIAHSFNGIRLILLDIGVSTRMQKALFFIAALTGVVLFVIGAWPIIGDSL